MGKTLLFLALLLSNVARSQINDNFSDGEFTLNPTWIGTTQSFGINAAKQLQSVLSNTAQTITLSTANAYATNVKWEFFMQMNFDPSATNLARIYLVSNQQDLNGALNGYFLQVGEAGSTDSYDLYRQTGTTITKIIDGPAKTRANVNQLFANIRITRDNFGKWELYTDNAGGSNYTLEGTITDKTFISTSWFGVYCRYTATRSDQFIFDNFSITDLVPDQIPPALSTIRAINANVIEAVFSEGLENASALMAANYNLNNGFGPPISVSLVSQNVYQLTFAGTLASGDYTLTVNNVNDLRGNAIAGSNTANLFYIKPYNTKRGDLVINEIFADPTPQIGLPADEFVELWNTTNEYILLNGWKYADQTTTYTFGIDTIKPNSYLILCPVAAVANYKNFGKAKGLSPWPSLNNDKDILKLSNLNRELIDQVAYSEVWYQDNSKKQGGYTLELIDPKNRCTGIQNWLASTAPIGGTPGKINAIYQSQVSSIAPKLLTATIIDATTVRLQFSKYVDSASAATVSNYSINNGVGAAIEAHPVGPTFTSVEIKLAIPIERGLENTLSVTNLTDCAGNLIDGSANTTKLFWAKEIKPNDILISEALFNPKGNGVDYVEVYNDSKNILDLKELQLANADNTGQPANGKTVTLNSTYILPGAYWVFTSNANAVKEQYFAQYPSQFVQLASMPSFNNDKGAVVQLKNNMVIDRFDYNEKMHLALLKDPDGVALERVSFSKATNAIGNFTSAAQTSGFGTPTAVNSQNDVAVASKNEIKLSSKTFSPDGDGFEDFLNIEYQMMGNGNLANVNIYTDKGILIRKLQRNTTIGVKGAFVWDGLNDSGQLSGVGIYIIKFDVFSLNGKIDKFTKTCVLAAKL